MKKRPSIILIPLALVALAVLAVRWGVGRLTAPRPLRAAAVDTALLESQDPMLRWLRQRAANPAQPPEGLDIEGDLFAPRAGAGDPVPELGRLWQRVQASEAAARSANPLPLAGPGATGLLLEQIQGLATAYQQTSQLRGTVAYDLYQRAVDDYWPSYPRWIAFDPLVADVRQRALATGDRNQLTSPYLKTADLLARGYRLQAIRDRVRWEATQAAFQEQLQARLAAFDAEWDQDLDRRLRALERAAETAAAPDALVPPGLLRPVPDPDQGSLAPTYAAMVAAHREAAGEVDLGGLFPSPAEQRAELAVFEEAYRAVRQLRYEAALAGEGLELQEGGEDLTEAIGNLLYVRPRAEGEEAP